jgi:hypothetical protein
LWALLKVAKIEKSRDHEEIFLDHYDWLFKNASRAPIVAIIRVAAAL